MTHTDYFDSLRKQSYIALSTFRRNGDAVVTPVWFTQNTDRLYVWTDQDSGKVKRIRNNPLVRLAPSTFAGKPVGDEIAGVARLLEVEVGQDVLPLFETKYGVQFKFFNWLSKRQGHDGHIIVEITSSDVEGL